MKKGIAIIAILAMIMTLFTVPVFAQEPEVTPVAPNYAFIPNSGEASVSKVDLVNMEEVARYFTEPRGTIAEDYNWRTSRIAMDADGNAWVLNTGADGTNLQGSVVRIQADTTGLTTNTDPTAPLAFGTDEAVKVFTVGGLGDMPRAIAIDEEGFIWIGFYSSGALMKYSFNGTDLVSEFTDPIFNVGNKLNYYEMKFAPDGTLFISSRNSTPTRTGVYGVWSFKPTSEEFTSEWAVNSPYSLLIDPDSGQVYATSYNNQLWIRGVGTEIIEDASQLRGMSFDSLGNIWIADTVNHNTGTKIFWYKIADKTSGFITLPIGTAPVGVGQDAAGLMWAICRTDGVAQGYIVAFDPATKSFITDGNVQVGYRPYAYGDFVVPQQPEFYNLCGFKLDDATGQGLAGWTINLEKWDADIEPADWVPTATTTTGSDGKYCFANLPAGTYRISEGDEDGWIQTFPGGDGMHEITLPADLNLIENGDFELGNGVGFTSGYDYVATTGTEALWGEGDYAIGTDPRSYHYLWESYGDHTTGTGNMMIVNGEEFAAGKIVWSDSVAVDPGEDYTFSFWGATSYPAAYSSLEIYINDVLIDTYHAPAFLAEWTKYATTWNSGTAENADIKLICNTLVHTGNDFALDDIMLTAHDLDFKNMEQQFYDICGYKLDADTGEGLEGWTINLEKLDADSEVDDWVLVATTTTGSDGKYCFANLVEGDYKVSEENQDGWIPTNPTEGALFLTLPDGASNCEATLGEEGALFYNFENAELFNLCGFKYGVNWMDQEATDNPLAGWPITLLDSEGEEVASTTTDAFGHYCFMGLRAGDYTIVEGFGELGVDEFWNFDGKFWRPVGDDFIEVTLPADATICEDPESHYNFFNQCFGDQTAWMFGDISFINDPTLALGSNNWGWSQALGTLSGTESRTIITQPIYAGAGQEDITKGYLVGYVAVKWDGAKVSVDISDVEGAILTDAKVWVGNTALPLVPVGKNKTLTPTNAPGKLIVDPKVNYELPVFVAIHFEAYVPCGFPNAELETPQ